MTETVDLGKFPLGQNNVAKETSLPEGALREAINVDVDNSGNIRRREGYALLYSGIDIDSLYKRYFREAGELKYLNDDNTATVIVDVVGTVSYTEFNDLIYYTDGLNNGILDGFNAYPLGIPTPRLMGSEPTQGQIVTTYTYRDQITGEESGAARALYNATTYDKVGYDTVRYDTTGDDGRLYASGRILQTQFLDPIPAGQIIEYYKGKLYIAEGSTLWFSQPHYYGLTRISDDFFNFPSKITICIAVDSGIYVVADKTYFITFSKTEEAQIKEVSQNKAVEGTGLLVPGSDLGYEFEGEVAYWFSEVGPVAGLPNGQLHNLTDDAMAVPDNTDNIGASLYRETNGIRQIISTMAQGGEVAELQSRDVASVTVIRNGIVV